MHIRTVVLAPIVTFALPLTACSALTEAEPRPSSAARATSAETVPDEQPCKDLIREELTSEGEPEAVTEQEPCVGIKAGRVDELIDEVGEEIEQDLEASTGGGDVGDLGDDTVGLSETVAYETDTEVSLTGFSRGVSSAYAAPASAAYVRFTVKVVNGGDTMMDLSGMSVACVYGDDGKPGEQIFDSENGLDGTPTAHLRPGRSMSTPVACELPKDEKYVQVEVSPDFESETAVFAGNVK
ncbi:hypothetical protein ACWGJ2_25360 [Streptomyces sp. NPDC054796]